MLYTISCVFCISLHLSLVSSESVPLVKVSNRAPWRLNGSILEGLRRTPLDYDSYTRDGRIRKMFKKSAIGSSMVHTIRMVKSRQGMLSGDHTERQFTRSSGNTGDFTVTEDPFESSLNEYEAELNALSRPLLNESSSADDLAERVRVLCWLLTFPIKNSDPMILIQKIWRLRCKELLKMSATEGLLFILLKSFLSDPRGGERAV